MTMPSKNPAFSRGFPAAGNSQYGGWGAGPQQTYGGAPTQYDPYSAPSPYAATGRAYMTMDDVVTKTGLSFLITVISATLTWVLLPQELAWGLALPAVLVAFVLGLVISFKQIASPAATLSYGFLYGIALGAISEAFNDIYPGIVMQAVIGTFGVFAGMLVVYKTGAIRVTPRLTRMVVGALFGALVLLLVNLVVGLFVGGDPLGLQAGGPVAIVFALVMIVIASFMLLLDFDTADEAIRRGAPPKFAWYIAFGLLVTVVWLYLEILRLLSYLRD
jgi:uncharacterized YccA/Bax inhibitor family protein